MRHAALEEFVAVHRAHDLFRSVHAVDADGAGKFLARLWRTRQMQITGERLALAERYFHPLDRPVHQRRELVVTGDHAGIVIDRLGIVLEDRPARGGIEQRRDKIALARRDVAALLLEILRLHLAAMGGGGEFAMHVGEFAHPHADGAEIADGVRAGRIHGVIEPRLVPFHTDGLDDAVDQPALVLPALDLLLGLGSHHARCLRTYPLPFPTTLTSAPSL